VRVTSPKPQVVIVGAGFGGLAAARALRSAPGEGVVIDQQNHHCFQPLLYQVATAALSPADIAWPIRSILNRQANARVFMARVEAIDVAAKQVRTDSITVDFDYLVLATGVTHSYFGHDDWADYAPGLKRITDATVIRQRFLRAFERAELTEDAAERRRLLTFIIIGGGPTGVEMAGAMAEVARHTLRHEFRNIDPRSSRIVLIEGGPRLLPTFPESLSRYAQTALESMGVEIMLSTMVTGCDRRGVTFGSGSIEGGTIVWAAGVVASPAARWLEVAHDRAGRVRVAPDLSVPGHADIFVIGDTAAPAGEAVPGIAPAAKQMGRYVGKLIARRVADQAPPGPFVYRHAGDLATIGRKAAVVRLGRVQLTGFIGWLFWSVAHIYFLIGIRNRFVVAVTWLWSFITLKRGARLISNPPAPRN
jgi:NADH dehydrogenase